MSQIVSLESLPKSHIAVLLPFGLHKIHKKTIIFTSKVHKLKLKPENQLCPPVTHITPVLTSAVLGQAMM